MGVKTLQVYQGDEWMTHHPTVAQAYDTLDRLRVLCVESMPESAPSHTLAVISSDMPRRAPMRASQENLIMALAALAGLADDLAGELDAATAELSPYLQNDTSRRWMAFEIQTHLNAMREAIQEEREADEPSIIILDDIMIYAERIDTLLKQIDQ